MSEYICMRETFHKGQWYKEGAEIESNEDISKKYPLVFGKLVNGKVVKTEVKAKVAKPASDITLDIEARFADLEKKLQKLTETLEKKLSVAPKSSSPKSKKDDAKSKKDDANPDATDSDNITNP